MVQSVGTQTQTTAVKNTAGQLVSQVVGHGTATVSSLPNTPLSITSTNSTQNTSLTSLPMAASNNVSSETLEQLREFESVFEKVSNKSTKDEEDVIKVEPQQFPVVQMKPAVPVSSAASEDNVLPSQLLDTTARTSQGYVYSSSPSPGAYIT